MKRIVSSEMGTARLKAVLFFLFCIIVLAGSLYGYRYWVGSSERNAVRMANTFMDSLAHNDTSKTYALLGDNLKTTQYPNEEIWGYTMSNFSTALNGSVPKYIEVKSAQKDYPNLKKPFKVTYNVTYQGSSYEIDLIIGQTNSGQQVEGLTNQTL